MGTMLPEWNEKLREWKEKERDRQKCENRKAALGEELVGLRRTEAEMRGKLGSEQHDVDKLTKLSFSNFYHTLIGDKGSALQREQREAVEAKLKYAAAAAAVRAAEEELKAVNWKLGDYGGLEEEYKRLVAEKEDWIRHNDTNTAERLHAFVEQIAVHKANMKELKEAETAGKSLVYALEQAAERLHSAKNWGTYDMLGGGMISTAIKHDRMDEAQARIHEAQTMMRRFDKELKDVNQHADMRMEISGMLTFADYFFDGFITDWMVQGKINDSLHQVEDKLRQVRQIVERLEREQRTVAAAVSRLQEAYTNLIEQN